MNDALTADRPRVVMVTGGHRRIGRAIADRLRGRGWEVIAVGRGEADFADALAPARLFDSVVRDHPRLAYLVNNAAVYDPGISDGLTGRINAEAPEKLTALLGLRLMEHAPFRGAVVNLLDAKLLDPAPGGAEDGSAYARSKRRLWAATRRQAGLFAQSLRVNAVAPGAVLKPERVREAGGETLLGRPTPEDVARAVEFLLEAGSVTGECIRVDGGRHLMP